MDLDSVLLATASVATITNALTYVSVLLNSDHFESAKERLEIVQEDRNDIVADSIRNPLLLVHAIFTLPGRYAAVESLRRENEREPYLASN